MASGLQVWIWQYFQYSKHALSIYAYFINWAWRPPVDVRCLIWELCCTDYTYVSTWYLKMFHILLRSTRHHVPGSMPSAKPVVSPETKLSNIGIRCKHRQFSQAQVCLYFPKWKSWNNNFRYAYYCVRTVAWQRAENGSISPVAPETYLHDLVRETYIPYPEQVNGVYPLHPSNICIKLDI